MAVTSILQEGTTRYEKYQIDSASSLSADDGKITFDRSKPNNSDQAGQQLAVTISAAGTIKLAGENDAILGRLENVESDGWCTVAVWSQRLHFRSSGTITVGKGLVGAGTTAATRGRVQTPADATVSATLTQADVLAITSAGKARGIAVDTGTVSSVPYVEAQFI